MDFKCNYFKWNSIPSFFCTNSPTGIFHGKISITDIYYLFCRHVLMEHVIYLCTKFNYDFELQWEVRVEMNGNRLVLMIKTGQRDVYMMWKCIYGEFNLKSVNRISIINFAHMHFVHKSTLMRCALLMILHLNLFNQHTFISWIGKILKCCVDNVNYSNIFI